MPLGKREAFDPQGEYVALRDFRYLNQKFSRGDVFSWRELNTPTRKLLNMYNAGFVAIAPAESKDEKKTDARYDPETDVLDIDDDGKPFIADADGKMLYRITVKEFDRLFKANKAQKIKKSELRKV